MSSEKWRSSCHGLNVLIPHPIPKWAAPLWSDLTSSVDWDGLKNDVYKHYFIVKSQGFQWPLAATTSQLPSVAPFTNMV